MIITRSHTMDEPIQRWDTTPSGPTQRPNLFLVQATPGLEPWRDGLRGWPMVAQAFLRLLGER